MSDVTIDATVIKSTQDILGKYVKKPVLSDKLLKKPPFRFLHDVINTIIRDTGCFEGLYSPEELNYENITDRDAKMQFLQKMIDALKIATNEPVNARPSKIVAGHEPDKTNELLQLLGSVVENKIDWKNAVEIVSTGGPSPNPKSKTKEKVVKEKKTVDKPSPKEGSKKSDKDKAKTEDKEKSKSKDAKERSSRKSLKSTEVDKKEEKKLKSKSSSKEPSKRPSPVKVTKTPPKASKSEPDLNPELKTKTDVSVKLKDKPNETLATLVKETIQNDVKDDSKIDEPPEGGSPPEEFKRDERRASKRAEEILLTAAAEDANITESRRSSGSKRSSAKSRRSSAEKSRNLRPDNDINGKINSEPTEALKTVAEEPSPEAAVNPTLKSQPSQDSSQNSEVKRESTFVRENSKEAAQNPPRPRTSLRPPSARPASARPGAPRRRDKNIEIILQPNDHVKLSGISVKLDTFNSELEDDGENLVIIENPNTEDALQESLRNNSTVREDDSSQQGHLVQQILETQKELVQGSSTDTEQKQDKDNDMAKLNSRQSSARQMNSLRDVIQNLTKSVNPLGKLMDFIPEDIDAMQLELTMWRDTYNQSSVELKKERSLTESVTEPMKNQLVTIESTIKEYHEMIDGSRAKILQNAEKIQRLLTTQ